MASQRSSEPDIRFEVPLYRMAEAAKYLGVPTATFATWAKGYVRRPPGRPEVIGQPIVTALPSDGRNYPTIPFIGLAEGMALAAFRSKGVALQRIRPALMVLAETVGLEYALASKRLYTDGAEVVADPERSFGQPIFARGAAKVADVLERFWAGEDLGMVSDEFGVPRAELEDVLRVASRRA